MWCVGDWHRRAEIAISSSCERRQVQCLRFVPSDGNFEGPSSGIVPTSTFHPTWPLRSHFGYRSALRQERKLGHRREADVRDQMGRCQMSTNLGQVAPPSDQNKGPGAEAHPAPQDLTRGIADWWGWRIAKRGCREMARQAVAYAGKGAGSIPDRAVEAIACPRQQRAIPPESDRFQSIASHPPNQTRLLSQSIENRPISRSINKLAKLLRSRISANRLRSPPTGIGQ